MDMLEIGNGNMTLYQQQTHQSFWAALKSPLIIGADLRVLSEESLDVLKNPDIIAISQDGLGKAVTYLEALSQEKKTQIWAGPLSADRTVVLVLNEENSTTTISVPLGQVPGLSGDHGYRVRDVWAGSDLPEVRGNWTGGVEMHQTKVLIFSR